MDRTHGAGHVGNRYVAEDIQTNRPPTELTPEAMNFLQEELVSLATMLGDPLNAESESQARDTLIRAILQNRFIVGAVAGSANAISAAFTPVINAASMHDGMAVLVRAGFANTTATPTFTPNAASVAALPIVKGSNLPLVAGDIAGPGYWMELIFDDVLGKWVLKNPATGVVSKSGKKVGEIFILGASTPPEGALLVPTSPTSISRTAYADLRAEIGDIWGAGDGINTFGMPYCPPGYTFIQFIGAIGAVTIGDVRFHSHPMPWTVTGQRGSAGGNGQAGFSGGYNSGESPNSTNGSGSDANYAAGVYIRFAVQYQR